MRILRALVVSTVLLSAARPAESQVVRGTVVDSATGAPLRGVPVMLERGERSVGTARTDSLGVFSVTAPGAGTYQVRVRFFGFGPVLTPPFSVAAGATVSVRVTLSKAAYALDTVRTTATGGLFNVTRGQAWFTKHEREGKGLFVSGFEVLSSRRSACDFFASLPGLAFAPGGGAAPVSTAGMSKGGPPPERVRAGAGARLSCVDGRYVAAKSRDCAMTKVDRWGTILDIDSADLVVRMDKSIPPMDVLVPFEKVMGVEIYRSHEELPRDNGIPFDALMAGRCLWVQVWTTIAW